MAEQKLRFRFTIVLGLGIGAALHAQQPQGAASSGVENPKTLVGRVAHLSNAEIMRHIATRSPALPDGLREPGANVDGTVVVRLRFDSKGKVEDLRILTAPAMAGQLVLDSLKNWRFTPVVRNGKNSGGRGELRIHYVLHNGVATMTVEPDDQ